MIEGVKEVGAELELDPLPKGEILRRREVPIVDRLGGQRVASGIGQSPRRRRDVLCVGIIGKISYRRSGAVLERGCAGAGSGHSVGVDDGPVAGGVAAESGV